MALPAPSDREKSQMYLQRYVPHLPAAGEIVLFDRSWYNRAGVERVMGFCDEGRGRALPRGWCRSFERAMVDSGIILIKYWLEVSPDEQTRRLEARIDDPRKIWKLSPMDLKSYSRWYDYSRARDEMLAATDLPFAPWYIVRSDDKKRARLNLITHLSVARFRTRSCRAKRSSCRSDSGPMAIASRTSRSSTSRRCSEHASRHLLQC